MSNKKMASADAPDSLFFMIFFCGVIGIIVGVEG
jgi:hypothetical protein